MSDLEVRDASWERSHLYALFYEEIDLCGCGNPADAYNLIRDLMNLCPLFKDQGWARAGELIGSEGAVHIVLGALNRVGLIEHGSVITGSWLTPKGEYARELMRRHEFDSDGDRRGVDEGGLPHDGDECAPECWSAPDGPRPEPEPPSPLDVLPRHRNPYLGCRQIADTWVHGRPHDCPPPARG